MKILNGLLALLSCLCLQSCLVQRYLLYNSSDKDVIVTGPYERCPHVGGFEDPYTIVSRSHNCEVIINLDSIISAQEYMSHINSLNREQLYTFASPKNHLRIVVHPNGYLPVAAVKHPFFNSPKHITDPTNLLNPMIIITHNDSVTLHNRLNPEFPLQFKPSSYKEINGIPVLFDCK